MILTQRLISSIGRSFIEVELAARLDLWRLIENLRDRGTTILLTTHQLAEAEHVSSRIALILGGREVAQGRVSEPLSRLKGSSVAKVQSRGSQTTMAHALKLGWTAVQIPE